MSRPLPVAEAAIAPTAACCSVCEASAMAADAAGTGRRSTGQPPLGPSVEPTGPLAAAVARDVDRRITGVAVGVAAIFIGVGVLSALIPAAGGGTAWLPLHLVLAGAAGTAIAGVLPFYTTALAAAAPADPVARLAAIALVATGALVVAASGAGGSASLGFTGGSIYLTGILVVAVVAFAPLRGALGVRRPLVERGYAASLVAVGMAVTLATAMLAGWGPVVGRWAVLKPAHVWLNLVGFLSVVIVTTLIHLAPTVEGSRILPRRSAAVAVVGLVAGAALVAAGYGFGSDIAARVGAVVALTGAVAVPIHAILVRPASDPWTTDPAWHRVVTWSLRAASGWFLVAMVVMAGRVLWLGASPAAWSITLVGAPFVAGWALQVIVGSWSHLVPALGPGDPMVRALRRDRLGLGSTARLVALNGGVLLAWIGVAVDWSAAAIVGSGLVAATLATSVGLAAWAVHGVVPSRHPLRA